MTFKETLIHQNLQMKGKKDSANMNDTDLERGKFSWITQVDATSVFL
jgi:hypothetical protein